MCAWLVCSCLPFAFLDARSSIILCFSSSILSSSSLTFLKWKQIQFGFEKQNQASLGVTAPSGGQASTDLLGMNAHSCRRASAGEDSTIKFPHCFLCWECTTLSRYFCWEYVQCYTLNHGCQSGGLLHWGQESPRGIEGKVEDLQCLPQTSWVMSAV